MMFVAEELRETMAELGFRTIDDMVGHPECLRQVEVPGNWKANELDLSDMLAEATTEFGRTIPGADGRHFLPSMAAVARLTTALDATLFIHARPTRASITRPSASAPTSTTSTAAWVPCWAAR